MVGSICRDTAAVMIIHSYLYLAGLSGWTSCVCQMNDLSSIVAAAQVSDTHGSLRPQFGIYIYPFLPRSFEYNIYIYMTLKYIILYYTPFFSLSMNIYHYLPELFCHQYFQDEQECLMKIFLLLINNFSSGITSQNNMIQRVTKVHTCNK
jgi:hypothetical protein